ADRRRGRAGHRRGAAGGPAGGRHGGGGALAAGAGGAGEGDLSPGARLPLPARVGLPFVGDRAACPARRGRAAPRGASACWYHASPRGNPRVREVRMSESTPVRAAVKGGSGPAAVAVETTDNAKLGKVSATYASQATCPRSCPWFGAGCYAES